jgi:lauroyl/myristoyl acyltransferase
MSRQIASKIRRAGGQLVSWLVRMLPRSVRFRAALIFARLAIPLLRPTRIIRERLAMRVETTREIVTYHLLDVLTRHGVEFDPIIRTIGQERLEQALAIGRGVLLVAPHAMLSTHILRLLYDSGRDMDVVSPAAMLVPGTTAAVRLIDPTPGFLLQVRKVLRANGFVGAMIDRDVVTSRSTFEVPTDRGPIVIADSLIQVAFHMKASVLFFAAHLNGGEVVLTFESPSATDSRSPEGITAAVVSFVQKHVAGLRFR